MNGEIRIAQRLLPLAMSIVSSLLSLVSYLLSLVYRVYLRGQI